VGVGAAAAGVTAISEDGLAAEAGFAASVASGVTVSEGGLTGAPVVSAVCVAKSLRGLVDRRVGGEAFAAGDTASTAGALTVSADGMTVAAGTAPSTTGGVLTVAADGTPVSVGAAASTAGMLAVAKDGLAVAAGTVASAAGVLAVADGLAGAAGVLAAGVLAAATRSGCTNCSPRRGAAGCNRWSVTRSGRNGGRRTVLGDHVQSGYGKTVIRRAGTRGPIRLVPFQAYVLAPRCSLRSTLLVLILRICREPSSAIV
jgi:hypothetical protein